KGPSPERPGFITERKKMIGMDGDPGIGGRQPDAGNGGKKFAEPVGIGAATCRLLWQASQLGPKDRGLELRHTIVAAQSMMLIPASAADPTDIGDRPGKIGQFFVIAEEDAALTRVQVLAGLKTKGPQITQRPDFGPAPLRSMRLRRI